MLDYGTKKQRLGNESMRRFDACALCLSRAREPVACKKGHLFCKECAYTDLLTQKKNIAAQKARLEALRQEAEAERSRAREAARERVLLDFERGQLGLGSVGAGSSSKTKPGSAASPPQADDSQAGLKRKATSPLSPSRLQASLKASESQALSELASEKIAQLAEAKNKLPDFWLPSLTPTHVASAEEEREKLEKALKEAEKTFGTGKTVCRGGVGKVGHTLGVKDLIPVKFSFYKHSKGSSSASSTPTSTSGLTEDPSNAAVAKGEEPEPMCPSCKKTLSNSVKMFLSKPCGHVTCRTCTDTLVRPAAQCVVCDVSLKPSSKKSKKSKDSKDEQDKDASTEGELEIVELTREGTGFASGGLAETSKAGVAFQG
ncbi:hypothetical protein CPC08DRAFT_705606 [Agrocybe pediades]|nr:hypothetical protein CPC08DRAFT_705606 [Agrocybe pediades]